MLPGSRDERLAGVWGEASPQAPPEGAGGRERATFHRPWMWERGREWALGAEAHLIGADMRAVEAVRDARDRGVG